MARRPGTPRLLRELNDRAALELLIEEGPLTRTQIGMRTGLSKVTASQLLSRLAERGLVEVVGEQAGGRGPNADLYDLVPSIAYVAGLEIGPQDVTVGIADISGTVVAQVTVEFSAGDGAGDPVAVVHAVVVRACRTAKVPISRLTAFVIGTPGVVDPRTGDVLVAVGPPGRHEGLLAGLRAELDRPVVLENDVNLIAVAERAFGAGRDVDDFALVRLGSGIGMAVMLGGRLHRGVSGGAGGIGHLPVPRAPQAEDGARPRASVRPVAADGFGSLIGADAIVDLGRSHGLPEPSAAACIRAAVADPVAGAAFLDDLADRISYGIASVTMVLDPGLVVLSGEFALAGGQALAERVESAVARRCPARPHIVLAQIDGNPVLRGALHTALERAREEVLSTTVAN